MLFWILFLLAMISPGLNMRRLHAARLALIRALEGKYGWRVITMIHREERVSFLGIPIRRYIDIDDSEEILRAIRTTPPEKPIALILHTPGGLVLAASQIARALKRHRGKKIVIIPHYAMSGGTLIALAADEIMMDPNAVLGPLDPQLASSPQGPVMPAPSIVRVAELKGKEASDNTLILADVARKAIEEMREAIVELLVDKMDKEKAEEVAELLTMGKWTHDYPITYERAKELGLPVKEGIPEEVYELMELYPQSPHNRPGVEYLPQPLPQHRQGGGNQAWIH